MESIFNFVLQNREWFYSGVGVGVLSFVIGSILARSKTPNNVSNQTQITRGNINIRTSEGKKINIGKNSDEEVIENLHTLSAARTNQNMFRKNLLLYWGGCSVTGFSDNNLLIVTHIKPWSECNNDERLDIFNGLVLIPNLDYAFDKGLITFDDLGKIIISTQITEVNKLGIHSEMNIKLEEKHLPYMKYHRKKIFKCTANKPIKQD